LKRLRFAGLIDQLKVWDALTYLRAELRDIDSRTSSLCLRQQDEDNHKDWHENEPSHMKWLPSAKHHYRIGNTQTSRVRPRGICV
jgi:hypothetical protein